MNYRLTRRDFVAAFGLSFLSNSAFFRLAEATDKSAERFAGAYMDHQKNYGIAILDQDGQILTQFPLPVRGHSTTAAAISPWLVSFARRPGNVALAIDSTRQLASVLFKSPSHTHFYGHGVFSHNGKILFATENEFESGRGVIGMYDTGNEFTRIGEIPSYGIGPHEMLLMPDGYTLCVANGGILTHPDTGRAKLNLPTMQSSIAFIDSRHGDLIAKLDVPTAYQRLSLRHMALDRNQTVWLGGQYEGAKSEPVPLIAAVSVDAGLEFPDIVPVHELGLANYVGSVSGDKSGRQIAFSSPKGNRLLIIDSEKRTLLEKRTIPDICGLAASQDGFLTTTHAGTVNNHQSRVFWDNHITRINGFWI